MAYRTGTPELLSRLAEHLSQVVDPALRMRLESQYLTLLGEYNNGARGKDIDGAVNDLWKQTVAGTTQYKLWPGIGTAHGQFYDNRDAAQAVLDRLGQLCGLQKDLEVRKVWLRKVSELQAILDALDNEAQFASTNVSLSRLDSLATQC
jgi:hypothetical protein